MATNPYFNQQTFVTEQDLLQSLMDEAIQIHGVNTFYLPRTEQNTDDLLGEDDSALFADATKIEMFIKDTTSFKGQSDFMSKFGLQIEDQCTFVVSVKRFHDEEIPGREHPRAGDIIWVQLKQRSDYGSPQKRYLFEIKFVEDKEQLFQLGYLYTYELRCELMTFSHEHINTDVVEYEDDDPLGDVLVDIDGISNTKSYVYVIGLTNVSYTGNTAPSPAGFQIGEHLYQGASGSPDVSGIVVGIDGTSVHVKNNVGTWNADELVRSLDSVRTANIDYVGEVADVDDDPATNDPIADNTALTNNPDIVVRGRNPRTTA